MYKGIDAKHAGNETQRRIESGEMKSLDATTEISNKAKMVGTLDGKGKTADTAREHTAAILPSTLPFLEGNQKSTQTTEKGKEKNPEEKQPTKGESLTAQYKPTEKGERIDGKNTLEVSDAGDKQKNQQAAQGTEGAQGHSTTFEKGYDKKQDEAA